jgi:hypothetical protein
MRSYPTILLYTMLVAVVMMALGGCAGSRQPMKKPGEPLGSGKRPEVFTWLLTNEGLLYTTKKSKQFCFASIDQKASEIYDPGYEPLWLYKTTDGFIIVDERNHPLSIYTRNGLHSLDKKGLDPIVIQNQDPRYLVVYQSEGLRSTYKVFDWVKNKVKVTSERPFYVVKDKALTVVANVLHAYTLDGKLLWQYQPTSTDPDLEGETEHVTVRGSYPRMLGIYNDELWIQPNSQSFIALNASTGKPIFTNFYLKEKLGLTSFSAGDAYLDEQSGKIKILAYSRYVEINLATHQAEIKKTHGGDWSIANGTFYPGDPRIYFTGNNTSFPSKKSIGNLTVGIFNTETLKLDWHYDFPDDDKYYFLVNRPQANEKYLAVKDINDTLFLFERQ